MGPKCNDEAVTGVLMPCIVMWVPPFAGTTTRDPPPSVISPRAFLSNARGALGACRNPVLSWRMYHRMCNYQLTP